MPPMSGCQREERLETAITGQNRGTYQPVKKRQQWDETIKEVRLEQEEEGGKTKQAAREGTESENRERDVCE